MSDEYLEQDQTDWGELREDQSDSETWNNQDAAQDILNNSGNEYTQR
ncbi:hypothetical protein [Spirochaeta isovalerica]|uniref:Uncharacterized protein n=1 Tax=Spirochaeta isovalerica TaxID=150 RepID=A0A841RCZ1_9SPIO|nr:hypothetical protein [Spirochaeta isovalerica]MBB6481526.1 hypothetical protein [Spirochaeta isovalerica]